MNEYDYKIAELLKCIQEKINYLGLDSDCGMHDFIIAEHLIGQFELLHRTHRNENELSVDFHKPNL